MSRKRIKLLVAVCATAVVALVIGAYAYAGSRDDLVADGVKVAGVDIGGMRASAAKRKLESELAGKLDRSVRVAVAGRRFHLTPERASLTVDIDGMVGEALDKSRAGGVLGRVWRGLTGSDVDSELPAQVSYSAVSVRRFVRRVKRSVDRPPRNADVRFTTASLPAVPSETGLKVNARRLLALVESALVQTGQGRKVRIDVRVTKPKVTTADLAKKYPVVVTVDRPAFKLRLFKRLKLTKSYSIAVGQAGLETPAGLYHLQDKTVNPSWHVPTSAWAGDLAGRVIPPGPDNPIKARWMGFWDGAGIHGTDETWSIGHAASHGCIRMAIADVEQLYPLVPLGTPIYVD